VSDVDILIAMAALLVLAAVIHDHITR